MYVCMYLTRPSHDCECGISWYQYLPTRSWAKVDFTTFKVTFSNDYH